MVRFMVRFLVLCFLAFLPARGTAQNLDVYFDANGTVKWLPGQPAVSLVDAWIVLRSGPVDLQSISFHLFAGGGSAYSAESLVDCVDGACGVSVETGEFHLDFAECLPHGSVVPIAHVVLLYLFDPLWVCVGEPGVNEIEPPPASFVSCQGQPGLAPNELWCQYEACLGCYRTVGCSLIASISSYFGLYPCEVALPTMSWSRLISLYD